MIEPENHIKITEVVNIFLLNFQWFAD